MTALTATLSWVFIVFSVLFCRSASAMSGIVRFTVSVEDELLQQFDQYCKKEQLATRSEAVRQLIHDRLTTRAWEHARREVAATLTLVYDHHRTELGKKLARLQHDHNDLIVATTHVHLTHDVCLEVIILRGPAERLRHIADQLKGLKGIYKGELVTANADLH